MQYDPTNPFIVQGDRTILVEVDNPRYAEARDALAPFAELEKSPEHIHTYRLTNLSLWNAAAAGMSAPTRATMPTCPGSAHSRIPNAVCGPPPPRWPAELVPSAWTISSMTIPNVT